jgi:K+-transporting ATPase KdpF subunit
LPRWPSGRRSSPCSSAWSSRATGFDPTQPDPTKESNPVLYLTAVVTALALVYLVYAMIRPERF